MEFTLAVHVKNLREGLFEFMGKVFKPKLQREREREASEFFKVSAANTYRVGSQLVHQLWPLEQFLFFSAQSSNIKGMKRTIVFFLYFFYIYLNKKLIIDFMIHFRSVQQLQ